MDFVKSIRQLDKGDFSCGVFSDFDRADHVCSQESGMDQVFAIEDNVSVKQTVFLRVCSLQKMSQIFFVFKYNWYECF